MDGWMDGWYARARDSKEAHLGDGITTMGDTEWGRMVEWSRPSPRMRARGSTSLLEDSCRVTTGD
jgi:hypothetical protein